MAGRLIDAKIARVDTFAKSLDRAVRHDPGGPLITYYNHATAERVELSATTYANWVAKAAGLLLEHGEAERGSRLRIDLPVHWLGPVFLGAAWTAGLELTCDEEPAVVVCGPDRVEHWSQSPAAPVVLACSLLPLGVRFTTPLPASVLDVGAEIWSLPDAFWTADPPEGDDPAVSAQCAGPYAGMSQRELMQAATRETVVPAGGRLLTTRNPASPPQLPCFIEPIVSRGSLVLISHLDPDRLDATARAERATTIQLS